MFKYIYSLPLLALSIVVLLLLLAYAHLNFIKKNRHYIIIFNSLLCFISLFILIYRTVLLRTDIVFEIELRPFYTFVMAREQVEYYRTFFMNCLLFVPFGLSMPYCLSKKPHKRNVSITIFFACVLSAGIEFLQYYYHLGRCETDDVIANTLGAAVGTLSYLLYMKIIKNQEKGSLMKKNIDSNQKLLLELCSKSLFGKEYDLPETFNCDDLIEESIHQTVFSQIFSFLKENSIQDEDKLFSQIIAKNIRVEYGHNEVHKALSDAEIPYVVLKGAASASYYSEPILRMMGDIDILVSSENVSDADAILKSIGFVREGSLDADNHIAYKRRDGLVCELHRAINGIPNNAAGDIIREHFNNIFDKAILHKLSCGYCIVPSQFHHGLILLLHTANHLTNEGVGLRHLCDWAVFVNNFSNEEFIDMFENSLKEVGLWRFAQLLTLCCIKYLNCDTKEWVGTCDFDLLDEMIVDILNGGNFGAKDTERYSHIKYISDRKSGEKSKKTPILQLFSSVNEKTKEDFKIVKKYKFLLPAGWVFTISKYFYLVIIGKRRLDGVSTIYGAKRRKNIYEKFNLFEIE